MAKKRPASLPTGTIDIPNLPPAERRIRLGELGAMLASINAGMVSINLEEPLRLTRTGRELVERFRRWSDEYYSAFPEAWPEGDRDDLNASLEKLTHSFNLLRESEERILRMGWKVDEKKGKLKRVASHQGKEYFTEHVRAVCRSLRRQRRYAGKETTAFFRSAVAREIRGLFPDADLDIRAGAPLYRAIRHFLERG